VSNTDSFIEEVTEEVRRDRLFAMFRKYGWIAVVGVVAIVGGASWNEYNKAQETSAAQATGDALFAALEANQPEERVSALSAATLEAQQAEVVRQLLLSAQQAEAGDAAAASQTLDSYLETSTDTDAVYRDVMALKSLMLAAQDTPADELRSNLEILARPGQPVSLLAAEQIALLDIREGQVEAAIDRLNSVVLDASASAGLRRRASQLIVALGGEPETLPTQNADQ
jgi:hypothetical protein